MKNKLGYVFVIACILITALIGYWFLMTDKMGYVLVVMGVLVLGLVVCGLMMSDKLSYVLVITCVLSTAVIGCGSLMDKLTPADIPQPTLSYVGKEPNSVGFHSLYTAREIKNDVVIKHRSVQAELLRQTEKDKYAYQDACNMIEASITEAEGLQDIVIGSEKQPFSILGILAGATGGGLIFNFKKRKGDKSPEEVEAAVAEAELKAEARGWNECISDIKAEKIKA